MASFNYNNPQYQRDIQRARAKGSMRGNLPKTRDITAAHTKYQLGRQLEFGRLAQRKQLSESQFDLNKERLKTRDVGLNLREKALKNDRSNLNWTIGLGLGQLGLATLEGRRRKNILEQDMAQRQKDWDELKLGQSAINKQNQSFLDYRKWLNLGSLGSITEDYIGAGL